MRIAILFSASWCAPCKQLKNAFGVGTEDAEKNIYVVDIDTNLDMPMEFGVRSVPTVVIVGENAIEIERFTGGTSDTVLNTRTALKDNPATVDVKKLEETLKAGKPILYSLFAKPDLVIHPAVDEVVDVVELHEESISAEDVGSLEDLVKESN